MFYTHADNVAIIHDGFAKCDDAKQVLKELSKLLPHADILSVRDSDDETIDNSGPRAARSQLRYLARGYSELISHSLLRSSDLARYQIVISNCAGFAKSVAGNSTALHICYCHGPLDIPSPSRLSARQNGGLRLSGFLLRPFTARLRRMDLRSSVQPDYYVAKSQAVAKTIRRVYGRNAYVIHPPVDTSLYYCDQVAEDYLLIVSPLESDRRIDIAITACNSLAKKLIIVGDGPHRKRLEMLAGPTICFAGPLGEEEIAQLLSRCQAVISPDAGEDLDLLPVRANASGRPAIAFRGSGAAEIIEDGQTGILCWNCSRPAIVEAIERCNSQSWDPVFLRRYADHFDSGAFRARLASMLSDVCGMKFFSESSA